MYAKLVVGASNVNIYQIIRDICRLITSANPSVSNLSGQGFSTTSSAILDNTPAGWTYVGSNKATDQPTIGGGGADATFNTTTSQTWACSAPMSNNSARLKYAVFSQNTIAAAAPNTGVMYGAQNVTALGVVTGPGTYFYSATAVAGVTTQAIPTGQAGAVLHLVATPRGIVIVREGIGCAAVLETTSTDVHEFYNIPAYVSIWNSSGGTWGINTTGATTRTDAFAVNSFGITDPNTGTYYAVHESTGAGTLNVFSIFQNGAARAMSQDVSGLPQYNISPVYLHNHLIGYPVQYISGVFPIYWCKSAIGSTGDTLMVGGVEYTFFNCGNIAAGYGLLMQTS
jgi:hypothetical protein